MALLFVEPDLVDGVNFILVDGQCYQRLGDCDQPPSTTMIDTGLDACGDCPNPDPPEDCLDGNNFALSYAFVGSPVGSGPTGCGTWANCKSLTLKGNTNVGGVDLLCVWAVTPCCLGDWPVEIEVSGSYVSGSLVFTMSVTYGSNSWTGQNTTGYPTGNYNRISGTDPTGSYALAAL